MRKIPTLFQRDPEDMRFVTREVHPDCQWVLDGEGVATRKFDGTCVGYLILAGVGGSPDWYARREVKRGKQAPDDFAAVERDETTGKTVGWEPIQQSSFYKFWQEAVGRKFDAGVTLGIGTYELCGPKINGNPEGFEHHDLVRHGQWNLDAPRDFDGLSWWLLDGACEGIVWHHRDGRMAKLKRRDFPQESA